MFKLKILSFGDCFGLSSGPSVIIRVLMRRKVIIRQEEMEDRSRRWDVMASKMEEEARSQGMWMSNFPVTGKDKEVILPRAPRRNVHICQHYYFSL